jgi:hypothetical protein
MGEIYAFSVNVPGFIKAVAPYSYRGEHGTVFYQMFESQDPELDRMTVQPQYVWQVGEFHVKVALRYTSRESGGLSAGGL